MSKTDLERRLRYIPELRYTKQSTATTYHFGRPDGDSHGWAIVTVNDETAELNVQSDYLNCGYRWHPDKNWPTLTHFIASRDGAHYLADKLTTVDGDSNGRPAREHFDAQATVRHFKRMAGQEYKESRDRNTRYVGGMSKAKCREICDALDELAGEDTFDRFLERYFEDELLVSFYSEPYHEARSVATTSYLYLLYRLIPQLIEACRETVNERRRAAMPPCELHSMAWFTGRWQDWHRGHGCNKDDGKPRTPEGEAEIAAGIAAGQPMTLPSRRAW